MNAMLLPHKSLIAVGVACSLLAACAAAPAKPDGAANVRNRLTQLQADPQLGTAAPLAIKDATIAVTAAEQPQSDKALAAHLVFIADRKVDIAQARAESQVAVAQRKTLEQQREALRLQARTQEADAANRRATTAEADASNEKRDANAARDATEDAQRNAQELQRQVDELHAKATDRGLVLTLGDVLFTSGTAQLNSGGSVNLGKLAGFLDAHPERTAMIEGHTDSVGGEDYNQGLSQRRADAVKSYLVGQGVNSNRLTASGKGKGSPVGDNSSATGRQQNRRVEVIIDNSAAPAK